MFKKNYGNSVAGMDKSQGFPGKRKLLVGIRVSLAELPH